MNRRITNSLLASALAAAFGLSYAQDKAPAPPPAWKQGQPKSMEKSTLAPHARKAETKEAKPKAGSETHGGDPSRDAR